MAKANTPSESPFGALTKAQQEEIATLTDEQRDALVTLLSFPANIQMSKVAESLAANGKVFRGWLRQTRKVSVSGHAGGCERQVPNADDYIAAVKRFVKQA